VASIEERNPLQDEDALLLILQLLVKQYGKDNVLELKEGEIKDVSKLYMSFTPDSGVLTLVEGQDKIDDWESKVNVHEI
jgi:hypothetical protein